ncbi:MAG: AMP-binding protein, partial [Gaiellaceae bacterium]
MPQLWQNAVAQGRDFPAYLVEEHGDWREVSWDEAGQAVDELARGFAARGLRKGDRVAILGRTTLDWALVDLALATVGVITVGIYPDSSARDCRYVVEHAECAGIVAEDGDQLAKVEAARLDHVLTFADLEGLRDEGRSAPAAFPEIDDDDFYTFIYTSGTTGPPKACMIRHRHFFDMVAIVDEIPGLVEPRDVALHFLPLAHNFGRLLHLAGPYIGLTLALVPDPVRIGKALEAVRPTILPGVPRVFETFHGRTMAALRAATGARGLLVRWALG